MVQLPRGYMPRSMWWLRLDSAVKWRMHLRLAQRGQVGRRRAPHAGRQVGRHGLAVPAGEGQGAPPGAALVEDGGGQVRVPAPGLLLEVAHLSPPSRRTKASSRRPYSSISAAVRFSVTATSRSPSVQPAKPVQGDAGQDAVPAGEGAERLGRARQAHHELVEHRAGERQVRPRRPPARGGAGPRRGPGWPRPGPAGRRRPAWPGTPWRAGRSGPGCCRCCWWPSRGGCAARGSAGSARSPGCRGCPRCGRRRGRGCGACSASLQARKPSSGPPQPGLMPKGWASPTASSAPYSPGALSTDRDTGLTQATTAAPPAWAAAARASTGSTRPR